MSGDGTGKDGARDGKSVSGAAADRVIRTIWSKSFIYALVNSLITHLITYLFTVFCNGLFTSVFICILVNSLIQKFIHL